MYKMVINTELAQCKSFSDARFVLNFLVHDLSNDFEEKDLVIKPMNKLSYHGDYPWRIYYKKTIG